MKSLPAVLVVVSMGWCLAGCGGAVGITTSGAAGATAALGSAHSVSGLKGDEDDDDAEGAGGEIPPGTDDDNDFDNDEQGNVGNGYYDGDDASVRDYGHVPSSAEERALTSVVSRYYRAAAADDGSTACGLIAVSVAQAIPEEFGQGGGPSYLRGAGSCQAVMARLFVHARGQLTGAIEVTGARVEGDRAYVLLGSATNPASYVTLVREGLGWKLDELIGEALP